MPEVKERLDGEAGRGLERVTKDPWWWCSVLHPDCDNLSIQAVTLYHGSVQCYHQGKLGTGYTGFRDLFVLFLTTPWKSTIVLKSKFHASNLDWQSVSHLTIYVFQSYSLRSSHPHLLL